MASNLSFFTFNTKNNTNILHINIIYQPLEYYVIISAKKRIIWMQGARCGFINGKQDVKAAESFVNFGLLFWVVWDAVANGPLTIYCLTGLLFTQSACTHQKFCSPAWLALTLCVPRPSADRAVCVQARNRRCSKIKQINILLICTPVYKFNIDELLLKLLAKRAS